MDQTYREWAAGLPVDRMQITPYYTPYPSPEAEDRARRAASDFITKTSAERARSPMTDPANTEKMPAHPQADALAQICAACHEANRAICEFLGDHSQAPWHAAPDWQRDSILAGIQQALDGATPQQSHQSWCDYKTAEGWTYGLIKDPDAKTHPCLVAYDQLPAEQQLKDHVYGAIVRALAPASMTTTPEI
jgi:hypothetical protein